MERQSRSTSSALKQWINCSQIQERGINAANKSANIPSDKQGTHVRSALRLHQVHTSIISIDKFNDIKSTDSNSAARESKSF